MPTCMVNPCDTTTEPSPLERIDPHPWLLRPIIVGHYLPYPNVWTRLLSFYYLVHPKLRLSTPEKEAVKMKTVRYLRRFLRSETERPINATLKPRNRCVHVFRNFLCEFYVG